MAGTLLLRVFEKDFQTELPLDGPLEVGRQRREESQGPYACLPATPGNPARLIIAATSETTNFARQHLLLEPLPTGAVRVRNLSQMPVPCPEAGPGILAGGCVELFPPFSLSLPPRTLVIDKGDSVDEYGLHRLDQETSAPGHIAGDSRSLLTLAGAPVPRLRELLGWLQTTMSVLQSTIGAADFLEQAARALVQIVGLDAGRVLIRDGDDWPVATAHGVTPEQAQKWRPSRHVLEALLRDRKAVWQRPQQARKPDSASLAGLQVVVAAPVRDAAGEVIGALYGERRRTDSPAASDSGMVEAVLVDLLATGVATGLARQQQEKAALKAIAQFEQFFTPRLARELTRQPDMLKGKQAQVTVLFCDVRGFSAVSEQLGAEKTVEWMNAIMDALSVCVQAEEGVLVDYIGDELMAMWGAPEEQPDQAARAVRAGLAMLDCLPALDASWQSVIGKPTRIGIGINTGEARVGNTGSKLKFKYGPLGNTVNVASRVQGLTKYLHGRLLVTRDTRLGLGNSFLARRVVKTRFVNITNPVDLFEVEPGGDEARSQFFRDSQAALDALENRSFAAAAGLAGTLLMKEHPGDGPLRLILSHASAALLEEGSLFDPIWTPPGK